MTQHHYIVTPWPSQFGLSNCAVMTEMSHVFVRHWQKRDMYFWNSYQTSTYLKMGMDGNLLFCADVYWRSRSTTRSLSIALNDLEQSTLAVNSSSIAITDSILYILSISFKSYKGLCMLWRLRVDDIKQATEWVEQDHKVRIWNNNWMQRSSSENPVLGIIALDFLSTYSRPQHLLKLCLGDPF